MKRLLVSLFSICFLLCSANVFAKSKRIEKTFKTVSNIKIETRYGKLQIKNWEKDQISFNVLVRAEGSNENKNETILENVTIDFTEGNDLLTAKTIFGDFFTFKKLGNSLFNKGKIKIIYTVNVPSYVNIDIAQRNGDVFIDSHEGKLTLNQTNGNFTAGTLNGENNIKISKVDFKVENLAKSDMEIANCDVKFENADKITVDSHDSDYHINVIDNLSIKSARDKIDIKEIEYLYGSSSNLSKIEVAQLGGEIDFDLRLKSQLNVFNVNNMFSFIKIDSKLSSVGLSFMEGCNMEYKITHKAIKFDNSAEFSLNNKSTGNKNEYVAEGKIGDKKTFSKLTIRANNGKIRLQ